MSTLAQQVRSPLQNYAAIRKWPVLPVEKRLMSVVNCGGNLCIRCLGKGL